MFDTYLPIWEIALRLLVAALLGMVIGWEREALRKEAGLRTHMLVALGAAGFMIAIIELAAGLKLPGGNPSIDASRAYQGLIGGIGFLGAGAIIQGRGDVHGITTAAGIWCCGALGLAAGQGSFAVAVLIAGFTITVLLFCRAVTKPLVRKTTHHPDSDADDPLFGKETEEVTPREKDPYASERSDKKEGGGSS